jgi:tryptophan synthase alpha chain
MREGRIAKAFARAKEERRRALVAYLCAGDPSLAATERLVPAIEKAGADVIELGIPFSDPIADGPVIQAASQRALAAGVSLSKVLEMVARMRQGGVSAPLVLMGYANPIVAMGWERFAEMASRADVDGAIVPDLPLEEAEPAAALLEKSGMDLVLLAAPTTPPERLARIAERTRGFLYFVSVTGVTGARADLPTELPSQLAKARELSRAPVAVGFGVSTPEQARLLAPHADGVVVGSAIVRAIERAGGEPGPVVELVRSLREAL